MARRSTWIVRLSAEQDEIEKTVEMLKRIAAERAGTPGNDRNRLLELAQAVHVATPEEQKGLFEGTEVGDPRPLHIDETTA